MRGPQYFFPSFSAVAGCLCILGLLSADAASPVSAAAHSPGIEAESHSVTSLSNNAWSTAAREGEDGGTRSLFSDDSLHDVSHVHDGTLVSPSGDTRQALPGGYVLEEDRGRADLVLPAPSPKSSKDGRRRLFVSVSTAFLAFALYLGLTMLQYKEVPPDPQPTGFPQELRQEPQPDTETVTAEQLLQSVDELKYLQPLAADLAEMVGTDESRSALQELCSSVKRSQDIAQTIAESSAGSSGSPLTAVKTAIEDSVSALSRLYEAARERGLSLAQEVQKERAPVFSEEEMQLLENGLGAGFREFMDFREQNLNSSLPVFVQKVERAAAELKGLRSIDGMDDLHLLMSVAKNLEMVKSACDSMQTEFACSDAIRASATTVLHMQYQREHASIHRELAGQVGEVRILCVLERQRRQIHPQQDISLLKSFRWLEKRLYRGEQQLQKHKEMIERMEEADNIISASNVEQQARTVVDSLKALLKAASSSWNSIPGAVSGGEAAQSEAMQGHLTAVACRAIGEAAAAGGRAVSMLNAVEAQGLGDSTLSWNKEEEGIKQPALQRRVNANLAKLIADALKQVDHVNAAMRKPVDADEETQEGRSSSEILMEEMLRASRTAAKASEAFVHDAELMWLRAQLNNSLDLDMQLSATLAQRATAAVGMATGEEPTQQRWHPEMSADDIKEFKDLLEQFHHLRDGALSANALNERASAAAMMKQAALKLTVFAEERQEQPRRR